MNQKIYRQEALDRLQSPDQFDQLMPLTNLRGWIALAVWWLGFVLLLGMDFWEAKILVVIVWLVSFVLRFMLMGALLSAR